jgi:hypothetical protein
MPTFKNQAELLKEGDSLFAALSANSADLGHLNGSREKLESLLEQMREALTQQSALTASKQETSKQLDQLFRNGAKLITFLRKGVAEHYGSENEKVVEFGLQPFRGRRRSLTPVPPPPPPAVE